MTAQAAFDFRFSPNDPSALSDSALRLVSDLPDPRKESRDQMLSMMGPLGSTLGNLFDAMEIAEEEIEAAKRRHPRRREEIHKCFGALCLPEVLREYPLEKLYRPHARELAGRVATGRDLAPGTDAEVLAALHHCSLAAPLSSVAFALYVKLFGRLFNKDPLADLNVDLENLEALQGPLLDEFEAGARAELGRHR